MNVYEMIAFIAYFVLVIGVGIYFFFKSKGNAGEKDYFLGGRDMNGLVAALSAGASDMSAWVLMGLPGAFYATGLSNMWISVGLFIGTACAWIFIAPRLRRFSIAYNDSITIPQYLTNRFQSDNKLLLIICAVIFVVAYCIYAASSISACGTLFNTVMGIDRNTAMIGAAVIIIVYTFLGGFNAVCWTDFFQGLLMLAALMIAPIIAVITMQGAGFIAPDVVIPDNYYNALISGSFDKTSVINIISGLAWAIMSCSAFSIFAENYRILHGGHLAARTRWRRSIASIHLKRKLLLSIYRACRYISRLTARRRARMDNCS